MDDVHAVAFANNDVLVSAGDDRTVRIWDLNRLACTRVLTGHDAPIPAISVRADGLMVASASRDNTIRLWDVRTGSPQLTLKGHDDDVSGITFIGSGEQLVSASYDGTLRWWDVGSGTCLRVIRASNDRLYSLAVEPGGENVLVGDAAESLQSVSTSSLVRRTLHRGNVFARLSFSPDARWLAGTTAEGNTQLFDGQTGSRRYSIQPIDDLDLAQIIQQQ
jgi:WD40 repeat protein